MQYNLVYNERGERLWLPFIAGIALTAPFWARPRYPTMAAPMPYPFPYPYPVYYPYQPVYSRPFRINERYIINPMISY